MRKEIACNVVSRRRDRNESKKITTSMRRRIRKEGADSWMIGMWKQYVRTGEGK